MSLSVIRITFMGMQAELRLSRLHCACSSPAAGDTSTKMAQHDKRTVTVEYVPNVDSTRPDEVLKTGVLIEILGTGPSQESITFE